MQWTPVDLETIAGILDTLATDAGPDDIPNRILDMLEAHTFSSTVPGPDSPWIDANAARVLAGLLRIGVTVHDPAAALTACLQYPLPDPTHGG